MDEVRGDHNYPCSQCGADLRFAPGQTQLVCAHCGNVEKIAQAPEARREKALGELDLHAALNAPLPEALMEETRVLNCPSCGAQVEFSDAAHAQECPYCASPIVTDTGTHRHIKPQAVIPFAVTEAEAQAAMSKWLGRLWFAPNGLREYARKGRKLAGLYAPYWTFDADTQSRYSGRRGTNYTTKEGDKQVTRTRWTNVSGRVARFFDDVAVIASESLPRSKANGLRPWDFSALRAYRPDYLAGFRAEGYTVDLAAGHDIAREEMARIIRRDVISAIGGDKQQVHSISTQWEDETFKHVLLPVWMAAYRYRGKSYRFIVNGQSGKVQGERPWSAWKIAFAVVLAVIAAVVIGMVSGNFQG